MKNLAGVISVPFHIGDFLSGTMHMDTLEKGAYVMLLMSHYQIGELGLPNNDKKLARICGVTPKVWKRIKPILEEKFVVSETHWQSLKCIDVLSSIHKKSKSQRAKAFKKHNPKVDKNDSRRESKTIPNIDVKPLKNKESDDATAVPRQCQPKPKPKPKDLSKDKSYIVEKEFEEFWGKYIPFEVSKGSKADALAQYKKALLVASKEEIIKGLENYMNYCHGANCKTKQAFRWLSKQCWQEEYQIPINFNKGENQNVRKSRTQDLAEQASRLLDELGEEGID